jgi:hypothetical protein
MKRPIIAVIVIALLTLACGQSTVTPYPMPALPASDSTLYGFFPSPPKADLLSVIGHYKSLSQYGDFVLFQQNVPWTDFLSGENSTAKASTDLAGQVNLALQNDLDYIFVVDPLNGLNRREFSGLPEGWDNNFANPDVRAAFTNYTLWVVHTFHPHYLGLASEINTYMDAYPADAPNFVSLYHEVYAKVKAEAPDTQVFVTFQWDDLNNMWPQPEEGERQKLQPNWDQVEAFEPDLDLLGLSSYPYFVFPSGADIPADYYSRALAYTDKPVAITEGGWISGDLGTIHATPEDQIAYLTAIHEQLGSRLAFWVYLVLNDFDLDSYTKMFKAQGGNPADIQTLGMFSTLGLRELDGTPKPALELWMSYRDEN